MKKLISLLLVVIVAAAVFIGGRWYMYVTNTTDPLDEVGIELNSRMPSALNAWGCAQLKTNFADRLPPYGCSLGDGTQWK